MATIMKTPVFTEAVGNILAGCLAGLFLFLATAQTQAADVPAGSLKEYQPAPNELSELGKDVIELLRSGDAARFATNVVATAQDRMSIRSTNLSLKDEDPLKGFQKASDYERRRIQSSAKAVLEKAAALHLDFAKGEWHPRVIVPKHFASTRYPGLQAEGETVLYAEKVEIIVDSGTAGRTTNGEFKLAVRGLIKFPGGWRSYEGNHWESFPSNVGDEKTRRELAIWSKVAAYQDINGQDDPASLKLGEALVRFIRERDPAIFEKDAYQTTDLLWAQMQKSGRKGPSRQELDEQVNLRATQQVYFARATIKQLEDAGIDLKNADIQIEEAVVESTQSQGAPGSIDGVMGSLFKLKLAVKSEGKSKNGTSLSGEYILAANTILRFEQDWKVVHNLHWNQLPDGILDPETVAKMKFENHVAQYGTLPPHTAAPEIEFITLDGEQKMKLSELKGKVVVLDFWATWCGPCQAPMAELQKLRAAHPDWKDRVAIVPVSIDDTIDIVRKHVDKRGWTNTFNVWAEDGGWVSKPAAAFRVTGVPTTYIIDAGGKIVRAGHPAAMPIGEIADGLLQK